MVKNVRDVVKKHNLNNYANVTGYSNNLKPRIRKGVVIPSEKCIRIYVEKKLPEDKLPKDQILPKKVVSDEGEEVCIDVVEVGKIRKLAVYTSRYRPAPCGVSTSRLDEVSAGTIGWWVIDEDFNTFMISNNHVWAKENEGRAGDPVIQPGKYDGGSEDDVIGQLVGFIPINFNGEPNYVDIAWATCIDLSNCYASIMEVGGITSARDPVQGERAVKIGRTTGITEGVVADDSATITVGYDSGNAVFEDVFIVQSGSRVIDGGDSGSPVIAPGGHFLGLAFAGNDAGTTMIACKQSRIAQALNTATGRQFSILVVNAPPPFRTIREYVYVPTTVQTYMQATYSLATIFMLFGLVGGAIKSFLKPEKQ